MENALQASLASWIEDSRERTLALVGRLPASARLGPRLAIVNPPAWEVGHVGWFAERWILRHAAGEPPLRPDGDALWDSSAVPHDARWGLPLPTWEATLAYLSEVKRRSIAAVERVDPYFVRLAALHEDMHGEAFLMTWQTLGYVPPELAARPPQDAGPLPGDARVPGGAFVVGEHGGAPFSFDNEGRAHEVRLEPFSIARAPVTQAEYAAFVEDGGYARRSLWSEEGWRWREAAGADAPVYWRRQGGQWIQRAFDRWVPLEPHRPVVHVCFHEAEAYCRWAGRRLPTEAEWEAAAAGEVGAGGTLGSGRRCYPWGDEPPSPARANLDLAAWGPDDVAAHAAGDSAFGCRQMLGNVWEWTASNFLPYPGFTPGPYRDYSLPWFGTHRVLRGGAFATRARLVHASFRNFYTPDRRDPFAGFRTCAP